MEPFRAIGHYGLYEAGLILQFHASLALARLRYLQADGIFPRLPRCLYAISYRRRKIIDRHAADLLRSMNIYSVVIVVRHEKSLQCGQVGTRRQAIHILNRTGPVVDSEFHATDSLVGLGNTKIDKMIIATCFFFAGAQHQYTDTKHNAIYLAH